MDRQNPGHRLALLLGAALLFAPAPVHAQDEPSAEETALARSLFRQGMEAVDAGDYPTAADRLGRALELRDSPVVRANYALALVELGRFVEASEHLRTVQRESEPGSDAHTLASTRLGEIQDRFGQLRIDVTGATDGVETRIDGRALSAAALGVPQPADPGARAITLHRGSRELLRETVTVTRGELATVALVAPPPSPEELAEAEAARVRIVERERVVIREAERGGVETEAWFWVLIGVLAAGAIAGVVTAVVVTSQPGGEFETGSSGNVFNTLVELP